MAFTYCINCGEKIDMSAQRCPHCGRIISGGGDSSYEKESFPRESNGYNPNVNNQNGYNPNAQSPNNYNSGTQNSSNYNSGSGYTPFNPMYRTPMQPQKRPISIGLLVFSIINIVFSCCTISSLVFGVLALVYTVNAQKAASEAEETSKKKTALVLNIVGIVLGIISMVSFSVVFMETIKEILSSGTF